MSPTGIACASGPAGANTASVCIHERGFCVKTLYGAEENIQAYHLRHDVFSRELMWVSEKSDGLEVDDYDSSAVSFGVFDGRKRLLAYLRLLLPEARFMIEKEFSMLINPEHKIRKDDDTAEVSRLCVDPRARNETVRSDEGAYGISMLLYKGVYHWCLGNGVRHIYLVVEHKVLRLLKAKGFPCSTAGEPTVMPDGVVAVAATMDWREFERLNGLKRPGMFSWFSRAQSAPSQGRQPRPEACLQRQVYA
jgi:N-acyl amino acid synthase of PEP-CTERM/exosortase system